jgi:hypothetical protein
LPNILWTKRSSFDANFATNILLKHFSEEEPTMDEENVEQEENVDNEEVNQKKKKRNVNRERHYVLFSTPYRHPGCVHSYYW